MPKEPVCTCGAQMKRLDAEGNRGLYRCPKCKRATTKTK